MSGHRINVAACKMYQAAGKGLSRLVLTSGQRCTEADRKSWQPRAAQSMAQAVSTADADGMIFRPRLSTGGGSARSTYCNWQNAGCRLDMQPDGSGLYCECRWIWASGRWMLRGGPSGAPQRRSPPSWGCPRSGQHQSQSANLDRLPLVDAGYPPCRHLARCCTESPQWSNWLRQSFQGLFSCCAWLDSPGTVSQDAAHAAARDEGDPSSARRRGAGHVRFSMSTFVNISKVML